MDVTQAYQTVEARLTQAVALTPSPTLPQTPTQQEEPTGSPDLTPSPTTPQTTTQPTSTSTSDVTCDQAAAAFPIDITIKDDTEMEPGQEFTKIWRLVNVGTCIWTTEYAAVWFSGEQLSTNDSIALSENIGPNQSVDIAVDMSAPSEPGTYQSNWKLRNADDELFGIGPNGESPFWVRIIVIEGATSTPTFTPTITATPVVQVSGSVTLTPADALDLDNNQINSGGEDLIYEGVGSEDEPQHQLAPQGRSLLGVFGEAQPTLAQCQEATLTGSPLVVEDLSLGSYLCYRTNLGLPGWAYLNDFNSEDATLTLEILTWSLP
ncbi:MAG: NBR1-Ig-like domain-containing protein [Anaerolineales bacterium]